MAYPRFVRIIRIMSTVIPIIIRGTIINQKKLNRKENRIRFFNDPTIKLDNPLHIKL